MLGVSLIKHHTLSLLYTKDCTIFAIFLIGIFRYCFNFIRSSTMQVESLTTQIQSPQPIHISFLFCPLGGTYTEQVAGISPTVNVFVFLQPHKVSFVCIFFCIVRLVTILLTGSKIITFPVSSVTYTFFSS